MNFLERALEWKAQFSQDEQIRYFGWCLLLSWIVSIVYMTRDFWVPSAFNLPPLREIPRRDPNVSPRRKLSRIGRDLQQLASFADSMNHRIGFTLLLRVSVYFLKIHWSDQTEPGQRTSTRSTTMRSRNKARKRILVLFAPTRTSTLVIPASCCVQPGW
ncbi:unnamed protein product [Caenorhabditis auriculariae]|uniref:Uncharacterized protein n=1 Tax=Caenorhabditis auriculariae TaxID=2777116 RepID=A0A8S1HRH9_9PELO|nr:unnamed protein product [Caenorhabditis auriculariae]